MTAYLTIVHALSALHAGTGQGSGVIDLPIAREKATGVPFLPGSSLKGALRTSCGREFNMRLADGSERMIKSEQIFGSEKAENGSNTAGTVQITDQRLLLLPVRSLAGTFAWVTSPYILYRLVRDLHELHLVEKKSYPAPRVADLQSCIVTANSCLTVDGKRVYLEDLDLSAQEDTSALKSWTTWLQNTLFQDDSEGQSMLAERLCVVHDDAFSFLLETAMEITARIRLQEESKTVQKGGLWYEEALPAESVLYGLALTTPRPQRENGAQNGRSELTPQDLNEVFQYVAQKSLQLGGKSTVGRGQCRVRVFREGA
ncbi:MAG TPA: type III-B CRISPR module RAMP protein Cmr4 [Ktedonobacteraceae bacterium]|nr:type III-B CRISPR module RAMP protein Cmr4 [Ktedonobacteraceae bacterium]